MTVSETTRPSITSRSLPEDKRPNVFRRRVPFLFSVRFGITAWYAGVLIITLALLGVGLRIMLVRALDVDARQRLSDAATSVATQFEEEPVAPASGRGDNRLTHLSESDSLDLQNILLSGVSVTVVDFTTDSVIYQDGTLSPLWPLKHDIQQFSTSREPTFATYRANGYLIRGYSEPIFSTHVIDQQTGVPMVVGMVFTSESLSSTTRMLSQLSQILLISGVVGGAVASVGGWSMAGRALAPVNRFMAAADDVAKDRGLNSLKRRLDVPPTGDEIAQLGITFNDMLDRIEQSFVAQQRFVADASHELRTPLTSIKGNVDVLRRQITSGRKTDPTDVAEALGDVSRETERMNRLITDLLSLARNEGDKVLVDQESEVVSLDLIAREAIRTAEVLVHGQNLTYTPGTDVLVVGDGDRLLQVILILIDNALRYTPEGGSVTLSIRNDIDPEDKVPCARIDVEDTGSGISPEHLPHLFERFYRAEDSRARSMGGTGLGLAIALSIIRTHGGWIDVSSSQGSGTNFTVWIPQPAKR